MVIVAPSSRTGINAWYESDAYQASMKKALESAMIDIQSLNDHGQIGYTAYSMNRTNTRNVFPKYNLTNELSSGKKLLSRD